MHLVADWALRFDFLAMPEAGAAFLEQPRSLADALWSFVEHQQAWWGHVPPIAGLPREYWAAMGTASGKNSPSA